MYRLVKRFDFDERPLGNYEDVPMFWEKLEGPGLPFYDRGQFDETVGRQAPPSFRLEIQTGNVAYEYGHFDLTVVPHSDYVVVGYVRSQNLEHSAAFVAGYFADRFGQRIPGSERITRLVRNGGEGHPARPAWQRVEMFLPGEYLDAYTLRLQVWILQSYVWREPEPTDVDPIAHVDTRATAWFDDIAVYSLPRARLRLSNPGSIIEPGATEALLLEVNNATNRELEGEIEITDERGESVRRQRFVLPGTATLGAAPPALRDESAALPGPPDLELSADVREGPGALRVPLPALPAGFYRAVLRLAIDAAASETPLLERSLQFAVLPALGVPTAPRTELGVDLGRWTGADIEGARELLRALGCGAAKIGITADNPGPESGGMLRLTRISELVRRLSEDRIEVTGVMLDAENGHSGRQQSVLERVRAQTPTWKAEFGPLFAHFGGLLPNWQLGDEAVELSGDRGWTQEDMNRVREHLERFVTRPELIVPVPLTGIPPAESEIQSVWVPPDIPTRRLPRMLGFLVDEPRARRWLQIGWRQRVQSSKFRVQGLRSDLPTLNPLYDLVRRIALAHALRPERLYAPAPFERAVRSGTDVWQPRAEYVPLRTLFHYLSGRQAMAATWPAPRVQAILFEGPDAGCMILWGWMEPGASETVALYLGDEARAIDLWGREIPVERREGRARIQVGPAPVIVDALDTRLALLEASFRLTPRSIQMHDPSAAPQVTFRNPFASVLSGRIEISAPDQWSITPQQQEFQIEPGGRFSLPLRLTLPSRQLAGAYGVSVRLNLYAPRRRELLLPTTLQLGLRAIDVTATVYWEGAQLIVDQTLHNRSEQTISFYAFCQPPDRARVETAFLDVAPGQTASRTYVFPAAQNLAGARLHLGIREIRGDRGLDQVVAVPNPAKNAID